MALTQRLEIRQGHALVMTPQLMQAIKLLQLSNLDLAVYVENELEKNPLLERAEGDGERRETERDPQAGADAKAEWAGETSAASRAATEVDDGAAGDADASASRNNAEAPAGYSEW